MPNKTACWDLQWRELDATPSYIIRLARYAAALSLVLFIITGAVQLITGQWIAGILSCIFMIAWVSIGIYIRRENKIIIESM
jgi:hypothetical protein